MKVDENIHSATYISGGKWMKGFCKWAGLLVGHWWVLYVWVGEAYFPTFLVGFFVGYDMPHIYLKIFVFCKWAGLLGIVRVGGQCRIISHISPHKSYKVFL